MVGYNGTWGNANLTEASMKTLYDLANPANSKNTGVAENTVVMIDPCINPDGRDRYANFIISMEIILLTQVRTRQNIVSHGQAEEPTITWFDLNRDWVAITN